MKHTLYWILDPQLQKPQTTILDPQLAKSRRRPIAHATFRVWKVLIASRRLYSSYR